MGLRTGLVAASLLVSMLAQAQSYPNQPIRLIVPWPPGGGVDTSARIIAQPLGERLGQSIVIDNRPGAGGNIGTEAAARAKPDGYTLLMGSSSPNAINIHIYPKLPFDPAKDFASIVYVTAVPNILVVPGASPHNSAQELIAHIKANPGKVNYGSAGVGSSQHLAASMLITATGVNIVHVPYKGTAPSLTGLIAGDVDLTFANIPAILQHVRNGRLRPLASTGTKRAELMPEVPTMKEAGLPGVEVTVWYGVLAPAAVPREMVAALARAVAVAARAADVRQRLGELGCEPVGNTPDEFGRLLKDEVAKWAEVVKVSGARAE